MKRITVLSALLIINSTLFSQSRAAESVLHPVDLRCEYLKNPLGIDRTAPRLSWKLQAAPSAVRGLRQTAFQIQIASTEPALGAGKADLWDSGKVDSDRTHDIADMGKPLESRQRCWWKVRIWDQDGKASAWSEPALWSMGLLQASDWDAQWIGLKGGDQTLPSDPTRSRLPARMLRREFEAPKPVRRATVYVSGLGFFDLYVNGARVGDHIMDPALTEYSKLILYVTFDVTRQLLPGKNALGVVLGNGRYYGPRDLKMPQRLRNYGYPRLLLQLEIEYADGTRQRVVSDGDWKVTADGPTRTNNEYDGEEYDARKEMPDWDKPRFNDAGWGKVDIMSSPGGRLQAQMLEPTRLTQRLPAVSVTKAKTRQYLVDFGQNFYGQVRLRASAPAGTVVKMREAYSLNPDGSLRSQDNRSALATDTYTFKGVGVETWSPRFRGQGFRRVEVTGLPGKVTADQFEGLVVENDLEHTGSFECSIPLLNKIYRNVWWGERMFLRNGVPLDPDRDERQGWAGDPSKDGEGEAFNFNVAAFYAKWINDVFVDQRPDGMQSDVSPDYYIYFSGDIAWPSVLTIIPDWYYSFYGDRRILEGNYEPMKKWVEYCARQLKADYTVDKTEYGDWCDTASMDGKEHDGKDRGATSRPLIGTAYCYLNVKLMARAAQRLGKTEDEKHYTDLAARIREGFNRRLFNPQTAQYESATQASYVLPLAFGLVPDDLRPRVVQNLVDDIMIQHQGYTTVGLLGMQWLMEVLTETGHADVALTIATRTKRPSWGYMIAQGATTIWERYDMNTRDPGMNSEALLIQTGDVEAWFYKTLAGIDYDPEHPGFKNIVMHPRVVPGLTFAKATLDSPQGKIASSWQAQKGEFHWNIVVPPNATATVYVPVNDPETVRESGKPASHADGVKFLRVESGASVYEVGSGSYAFTCQLPK
ncbi:MAG: family 78 glycoside hydrolase catalytic domain [Terriglobia bacterium]|jgi:alpha-L-rhamnosidase